MSENRTNEFLSFVKHIKETDPSLIGSSTRISNSIPNGTTGANGNHNTNGKQPQYTELRAFHQQAASISKDIASTSALLSQLAEKVKHTSLLFDDQDAIQVNALVVRIKQSIENLNSRLDSAQTMIQQQKRIYGRNSQAVESSANLVNTLQNEFATAASNFKDVLQQRTDSLKEADDFKRTLYSSNTSSNGSDEIDEIPDMTSLLSGPPPVFGNTSSSTATGGGPSQFFPTLDLTSNLLDTTTTGSSLPRPHGIAGGATAGNGVTPRYGRSSNSAPSSTSYPSSYQQLHHQSSMPLTPFDIQRLEEESNNTGDANGTSQSLQLLPTQQSDYLQSRAEAMVAVESHLVELGTVFNQLAGLVHEHGELVQRIDDNVQDTHSNVLLSMNVLTDTLHSLRTNKMLAFKLFSILVAFIILFIVFFA